MQSTELGFGQAKAVIALPKAKVDHRAMAVLILALAALVSAGCGSHGSAANGQSANPSSSGARSAIGGTNEVDPDGFLLHAQPRLRTVKIWLGAEELTAEVAVRPIEIATGMMFRTNLLENEAMLFVFPDAAPRNFYMRNCTVPLTAAYMNPEGVIQEFAKLDPGDTNGVPSRSWNIQFVLELPQGWHDRHNIRTGAVVRTDRGSLRDTFIRRK